MTDDARNPGSTVLPCTVPIAGRVEAWGAFSGAARLAGVIGWPVRHSLSPRLHNIWLRKYGLDGVYVPLAVRPDHFAEALLALPKLGFRGVNVTVPHKERALALVQSATPVAQRIGAVNTIAVAEDGSLAGDNTDGIGFLENLRQAQPCWRGDRRQAVVLGAGGAARAVVFALCDDGVAAIRLVNRTLSRAQALAAELRGPVQAIAWSERNRALADADLVVNTTLLGMEHQPPLDLDLSFLPPSAVVYDLVYAPLETALLAAARARGNRCVSGLGMLLHQARPGFAAWFGCMPELTEDLAAQVLGEGKGCSSSV